jgi:2-polyprenyl-3-methyl-5-hydroxy-6-metoxy-1,4-benzoquinol methylase
VKYGDKRRDALDLASVQQGNRAWWTSHTMSYDWREPSPFPRFSAGWFDDIDRRFLHAARLFDGTPNPFDTLMDTASLAGRRVLEIGCGMGFHTELLVRAGAEVTSIDLSPVSVEATSARMALKGLRADVRAMDAEALAFEAGAFDRVWSWGVIHHSSRTGRCVREIARVLRPGGDARLMVYNLVGAAAYVTLMRRYLTGFWRGRGLDELLWQSTDGFSARFYTRDGFGDLLATFFDEVETRVLGQEPDVVPLPAALRRRVIGLLSPERQRAIAARRGAYLFAVARTRNP